MRAPAINSISIHLSRDFLPCSAWKITKKKNKEKENKLIRLNGKIDGWPLQFTSTSIGSIYSRRPNRCTQHALSHSCSFTALISLCLLRSRDRDRKTPSMSVCVCVFVRAMTRETDHSSKSTHTHTHNILANHIELIYPQICTIKLSSETSERVNIECKIKESMSNIVDKIRLKNPSETTMVWYTA